MLFSCTLKGTLTHIGSAAGDLGLQNEIHVDCAVDLLRILLREKICGKIHSNLRRVNVPLMPQKQNPQKLAKLCLFYLPIPPHHLHLRILLQIHCSIIHNKTFCCRF